MVTHLFVLPVVWGTMDAMRDVESCSGNRPTGRGSLFDMPYLEPRTSTVRIFVILANMALSTIDLLFRSERRDKSNVLLPHSCHASVDPLLYAHACALLLGATTRKVSRWIFAVHVHVPRK